LKVTLSITNKECLIIFSNSVHHKVSTTAKWTAFSSYSPLYISNSESFSSCLWIHDSWCSSSSLSEQLSLKTNRGHVL